MIFQVEEEEQEEVLSLCDFLISDDNSEGEIATENENRSPHNQDFFDFSNDSSGEMSAAEDIFLRWKHQPQNSNGLTKKSLLHKRSESSNYQKLERSAQLQRRASSGNSHNSSRSLVEVKVSSSSRPKWYLLMFGLMKVPAEMEMKDIKSRQRRRNLASSSVRFPSFDGKQTDSVKGEGGGSGRKKLLRAFSSRCRASAVVTAALSCLPRPRV